MTYTWDGHPDPERLAAYIEQTLPSPLRSEVEAHLRDCEDCHRVVMDSLDLLTEERENGQPLSKPEPARTNTRLTLPFVGLAAAAVLMLAVWGTLRSGSTPSINEPRLERLVAAVSTGRTRPFESRLSPLPYAPAPAVTRGDPITSTDVAVDIKIAVAETEIAVRDDASATGRWALGLARLIGRDFDGAIAALEEAARSQTSGRLLSDLAAAHLARLSAGGPQDDGARALAAADRALALDPESREALFNRALAIEILHPAEAPAAWRSVVAQEGDSAWGTEAASRLSPR